MAFDAVQFVRLGFRRYPKVITNIIIEFHLAVCQLVSKLCGVNVEGIRVTCFISQYLHKIHLFEENIFLYSGQPVEGRIDYCNKKVLL